MTEANISGAKYKQISEQGTPVYAISTVYPEPHWLRVGIDKSGRSDIIDDDSPPANNPSHHTLLKSSHHTLLKSEAMKAFEYALHAYNLAKNAGAGFGYNVNDIDTTYRAILRAHAKLSDAERDTVLVPPRPQLHQQHTFGW
jgi:hypothetical protein